MRRITGPLIRWTARLLAALAGLLCLYALAALVLGWLPANRDWQPLAPGQGVTIWLTTNGVHTGLILPKKTPGADWSAWFPPSDTRAPAQASRYDWIEIGWGDRDVYLNAPEWHDLTAITALHALSGLDGSVLHVEYSSAPSTPAPDARPITLSTSGYARLVARLRQSIATDARGRSIPLPQAHYDRYDAFYAATGHYSPVYTCNTWTRDLLSVAGVRVPLWTPFDWPLFYHVRKTEGLAAK